MSYITAKEMQANVKSGKAKLFCIVGVQDRPVYEIDGKLFEKAIHFDDGLDHSNFYPVGTERAELLRESVAAQSLPPYGQGLYENVR